MKYLCMITAMIVAASCGNRDSGTDTQTETAQASSGDLQVSLTQVWETDTSSLITPECVTYDDVSDQLYVSNINRLSDAENAGYIALVNKDGSIKTADWVTGFKGPLGNDVYDGFLYVNDRNTVVKIEIATGEVVERIAVEGAGALNGMDIADDGTIYAADSRTNGIFRITPDGQSEMIVQSDSLETPNGILIQGDSLIVASSDGGSLKSVRLADGAVTTLVTGIGQVDGIIPLEDGHYLTSSWKGEVYFVSKDMEAQQLLDTRDQGINAADMAYIPQENLVIVPTFHDNRLVAYRLEIQ